MRSWLAMLEAPYGAGQPYRPQVGPCKGRILVIFKRPDACITVLPKSPLRGLLAFMHGFYSLAGIVPGSAPVVSFLSNSGRLPTHCSKTIPNGFVRLPFGTLLGNFGRWW